MEWCGCLTKKNSTLWVCCCISRGLSILCWSRALVFVFATHRVEKQSLGVKRICTTCIHNHISCWFRFHSFMFISCFLQSLSMRWTGGCAWSSSVKIYDYLCKRLLITARCSRVLNKMKNWWRHAYCGAIWVHERSEFKENKRNKLVWFIVFYWLIEWSLRLFPRTFFFRSINTRHLKIESPRQKANEKKRENEQK